MSSTTKTELVSFLFLYGASILQVLKDKGILLGLFSSKNKSIQIEHMFEEI